MSYYKYADFIKACENDRDNIIPINNVLENARNDFNLNTKSQLLDFIQNDGLENLTFVNTKDWENNPNKNKPIKVDAYEFTSMYKLGYIVCIMIKPINGLLNLFIYPVIEMWQYIMLWRKQV
jgi:hypothetical protein